MVVGCKSLQRKFLFFPSHHQRDNGLTAWKREGQLIGYAREVAEPENVWLMLHGNAGQAADRTYALPCFSPRDSVFILEYPGYGMRSGKPSTATFNAAAVEAYKMLRETFPKTPVCVVGESIGTGPASALAKETPPPDKTVLVVPYDKLTSVAAHHFPYLPVRLILGRCWDNIDALGGYSGPVEIFGALEDDIIPIQHARNLAHRVPGAKFHEIPCGHNDWSSGGAVQIRNR